MLVGLLGVAPAAMAAVPSPVIDVDSTEAGPSGDVVLAWEPVPGATSYKVTLSASASFTPALYTATTTGLRATPTTTLPAGTLHW